jgi:hypothetical protein
MCIPNLKFIYQVGVLKVIAFIFALILGIIAYLYFTRSSPVVYSHKLGGDPVNEPNFSILNPFRDRAPEQVADKFLTLLSNGQCEQAVSVLSYTPEKRQDVCQRETQYSLSSWRLVNRKEEARQIKMFYWCWHKKSDTHGQLWVTLEKQGEQWQITGYERWY